VKSEGRWITVHPHGPDEKGQPVLISEEGVVEGGLGGRFSGQFISEVHGELGRANSRVSAYAAFGGVGNSPEEPEDAFRSGSSPELAVVAKERARMNRLSAIRRGFPVDVLEQARMHDYANPYTLAAHKEVNSHPLTETEIKDRLSELDVREKKERSRIEAGGRPNAAPWDEDYAGRSVKEVVEPTRSEVHGELGRANSRTSAHAAFSEPQEHLDESKISEHIGFSKQGEASMRDFEGPWDALVDKHVAPVETLFKSAEKTLGASSEASALAHEIMSHYGLEPKALDPISWPMRYDDRDKKVKADAAALLVKADELRREALEALRLARDFEKNIHNGDLPPKVLVRMESSLAKKKAFLAALMSGDVVEVA